MNEINFIFNEPETPKLLLLRALSTSACDIRELET